MNIKWILHNFKILIMKILTADKISMKNKSFSMKQWNFIKQTIMKKTNSLTFYFWALSDLKYSYLCYLQKKKYSYLCCIKDL